MAYLVANVTSFYLRPDPLLSFCETRAPAYDWAATVMSIMSTISLTVRAQSAMDMMDMMDIRGLLRFLPRATPAERQRHTPGTIGEDCGHPLRPWPVHEEAGRSDMSLMSVISPRRLTRPKLGGRMDDPAIRAPRGRRLIEETPVEDSPAVLPESIAEPRIAGLGPPGDEDGERVRQVQLARHGQPVDLFHELGRG